MLTTQLTFDENGNLTPYTVLEVDVETFKIHFVDAFPNSVTRKGLYENYLRYLYRFQDEVFPIFEQWINGSFVTKKENPRDIDIVTFLDYRVYEKRGDKILDKFWTFSWEKEGIDAYIVKEYPESHVERPEYEEVRDVWFERYVFGDEEIPKGFLKINFEK